MDKQTAAKIIRDTFEKPFDKGRFINFSKNLVNFLDDSSNFVYQGNYIPDAYKPYIHTLERIGKYQDADDNKTDILIAQLKKETSLERARTIQRNFIAWYLNGSRGGDLKDAALVAFVSPDNEDWRFSLVKMDYLLEESPSGKTKVKTELTPARRFSFLVGENESSHTAQSQLVDILADDRNNPTLSILQNAFNIEVATREFFNRYRELFHKVKEALDKLVEEDKVIRQDFKAKGVNTVNFSKKLLGQIVFLYFLQKKGWLGVPGNKNWGEGNKKFLRTLFEKCNKERKNFFNDYLEYLFYAALNNEDRGGIDPSYYPRFECRIPFLNGGLFTSDYDWEKTKIVIPNDIFSDRRDDSDEGSGILDIFDLYNFTVKEDEPLEKEVAVDPETLGKVFENLLEVKDRKSKGTYYTPREIVHYMCQESLINYLDTAVNTGEVPLVPTRPPQGKLLGQPDPQQAALKAPQYRVLSPREDIEEFVRKGESTIEHDSRVETYGKETKRYSYKLPESIRQNAKLIDEKLDSIRVCDPAVGSGAFLVNMMTEVIRARNILTTYLADKEERRTNYNFKRHAIQNCLYGVDIDPGAIEIAKLRLWLSLVVDEEDIRQIQPLPNLDYKIVCGNSLLGVEKNLFNLELFNNLEKLKSLYFNETNTKRKQEYRVQIDNLINQITNNNQNFDFEVYFSEIFHEKGGFNVVIANPPYGFRNVLSKEEKTYFRKQKNIQFPSGDIAELFIIIALQKLVRVNGILTFIIPKKSLYGESWRNVRKTWLSHELTYLMDASKAFEKVLLEQVSFSIIKEGGRKERVTIGALNQSQDRIEIFGSFPLEDIFSNELKNAQIYKGIFPKSILNKINTYSTLDTEQLVKAEIGISNITQHLTFQATGNYPCIKGIDIIKYGLKPGKRYLKGRIARKYLPLYQGHKIVAQEIVAHIQNPFPHIMITMFYDDANRLINDTCVEIKILDSKLEKKFLLAYYQSNFCNWYSYNLIYNRAIRTMHFIDYYINQIPIPKSIIHDPCHQEKFVEVVDQILAITKDHDYLTNPTKQAKVKELERHIDQMVYELYDLTPEEIAVVEGFNK
ncbi:MAG: restriction endonuclease [Chloroflexi bacterium CG07_land_8_20_14_0_80_45_17]|nr:MAG: restriction endonuclease [Chloroflexi bacterium CG07_land_8_20_14_0_80_45_17]